MVNGKDKCKSEQDQVMEVCPNWALQKMAEDKSFRLKVQLIQKKEYDQAMAVSSYNEGRTVSDISNRTYVHGTREYLRPDTLWNDERYSNVTSDEIKAAKVRHEERLKAEGKFSPELNPMPHLYDHTGAQTYQEKPLYP